MKHMISTIFVLMLTASPIMADNIREWKGNRASGYMSSYVIIDEPKVDGAEATVTFFNTYTHHKNETFSLTWNNITIDVNIEWNVDAIGSERMNVIPPNGYIAIPPDVTVPEEAYGEVHLFKFVGM